MRLPGIPTLAFGVLPVLGVLALGAAHRHFSGELRLAVELAGDVIPAVTRPAQDVPAQPQLSEVWTNSIGMKLVYIPAGTFMMGGPADEEGYETQHQVQLTTGFWMGEAEVTRSEFAAFVLETQYSTDAVHIMGYWPWTWTCEFTVYGELTDWGVSTAPVMDVSWNDAKAFCEWLSAKEGRGYRLPTEAEWEYACRAGTTTPFYTGETLIPGKDANVDDVAQDGPSLYGAVSAGMYPPNPWGLYNMHGNMAEWCEDWWGPFSSESVTDPKGPRHGATRALRGGDWQGNAAYCRSAARLDLLGPNDWYYFVGFRIVMDAVDE